jgi:transposase
MIHITLNDHDRQQLEHTFKTTADRRLRDRCQALLMADRGRRHHQIAEDLRVTPRTLQRWLNAYCTRGLDGLRIRWAPGRAPRIPETLAPEIVAWVKQGPAGCGLARANWTAAALATYLYQRQGIASASGPCARSVPSMTCTRIAQPISISKAIRTSRKRPAKTWKPLKKSHSR